MSRFGQRLLLGNLPFIGCPVGDNVLEVLLVLYSHTVYRDVG